MFEERFSKEEQLLLNTLPTLVGSAMTFAGGSGLGTVKEMIANSRELVEGSKLYQDNEIISAIIPVMNTMKEGLDNARAMRERSKEHMTTLQIKSQEELRNAAISDAKKVNALLAEKASPQEAEQYKSWVLRIAEEVSKAAKEGGFLGFGGEQVSENEKALFTDLTLALSPIK